VRHVRTSLTLATAICAFFVVGVAPALAHQFVSSKTGKTQGRGFNEIPVEKGVQPEFEPARMQEWKLGNFKILCYKVGEVGEVSEGGSEELTDTLHYTKCGWYPQNNSLHVGATFSKSGLTITYHANGYVEALGNGEGEEVEFRKATVLETAATFKISSTKLCKIIIPAQTIPVAAVKKPEATYSAALYSNEIFANTNTRLFPTGQERIVITNEFKAIKYKYGAEGEETQCHDAPEFEKTAEEGGGAGGGVYKGTFEEQTVGGNLKFE